MGNSYKEMAWTTIGFSVPREKQNLALRGRCDMHSCTCLAKCKGQSGAMVGGDDFLQLSILLCPTEDVWDG